MDRRILLLFAFPAAGRKQKRGKQRQQAAPEIRHTAYRSEAHCAP